MKVVLCLGNEPLAFGPFETHKDAEDELSLHVVEDGICPNSITYEEHDVLDLRMATSTFEKRMRRTASARVIRKVR